MGGRGLKHIKWYTFLNFYIPEDKHGPEAKKEALKALKYEIDRQVIPNGFNEVELWINLELKNKEDQVLIRRGRGREEFKTLFYPSDVFPEYSVVEEDEDVLPEFIDYCHSKNLKVILYYSIRNDEDFVKRVGKELLKKYSPDGLAVEGIGERPLVNMAKEFKKIKKDLILQAYDSPTVPGWENWTTLNRLPKYRNKVLGPYCWLYLTAATCDAKREKFHSKKSFRKLFERALNDPEIRGIGLFVHTPLFDMKPYADIVGEYIKKANKI